MNIAGCRIEELGEEVCQQWLECILGRKPAPEDLGTPAWVLCHCTDGVTWGAREGDKWQLGSAVFPQISPLPSEANLLEMRVFSRLGEVLVWRTDRGLRGRILRDAEGSDGVDESLKPHDEPRVLLAGRVISKREGFTHVAHGAGGEQVLPLAPPQMPASRAPYLHVRHYFARDEKTGCVRVAVTRLMEVTWT